MALRPLSPLFSRNRGKSRPRVVRRRSLRLEPLETRMLLTAVPTPVAQYATSEVLGQNLAGDYAVVQASVASASLVQQALLTASDGASLDGQVAISGNTAAVVGSGVVYVFERSGADWMNMTQVAKLTASDGTTSDGFGRSIAIDGDTVVVGKMGYGYGYGASNFSLCGGSSHGAVYVFVKPTSGWTNTTETAELTAYKGLHRFGRSVAISGDTVVVGAPYQSSSVPLGWPGAVYVFVKPTEGWTNMTTATAELTASDQVSPIEFLFQREFGFGQSVAINGDTIAVGMKHSWNGQVPGAVYMFSKPGTGWATMTETAKLTLPGESYYTCEKIALSDDMMVLVANDCSALQATPQIYVFVKPHAGWTSDAMPVASFDADFRDMRLFPYNGPVSVAVIGNTIVATSAGGTAAHVFTYDYDTTDITAPNVWLQAPTATNTNTPIVTVFAFDDEVPSHNHGPGIVGAIPPSPMPDGTPVSLDMDWNRDGDFADPGEAGYMTSTIAGGAATFVLSLKDGTYRLRARVSDPSGNVGISQVATMVVATPSTIGLYDPEASVFYLRNTNDAGVADATFGYGPARNGWIPLAGDWDGDGADTIGLYNAAKSVFNLRNSNDAGIAGVTFAYGPAHSGWVPIAGDWNGDGTDTIGLYDPKASVFYLRNTNDSGVANVTFAYGPARNDICNGNVVQDSWAPVAGDWNGDGRDTVGLYNPTRSVFHLRNSNGAGIADVSFAYGPARGGWTPIAGDWNSDGQDTIGLYAPKTSVFYLANTNKGGYADAAFAYGPAHAGWMPIVGDWGNSGQALKAVGSPAAAVHDAPTLTQSSLAPFVPEAITRWASAGLNSTAADKLAQVQFIVTDLPGDCLGKAEENRIYIDANAAGNGWVIDSTPALDEEFAASAGRQLQAVDARAVDRIDLLSVVEHELGHIAGFDDLDGVGENVMSGVLGTGIRREV